MEFLAIGVYFALLLMIVIRSRKRALTREDFVIGSRSMNPWMTAMAAHASDMSNWLLMAFPGMIFLRGGEHLWAGIGLIVMMWLNWVWIAPKVRAATEESKSTTLVDFFEKRLGGEWPKGRLATASMLFLFYTVYVAGALYGMGLLGTVLFGVSHWVGVVVGVALILPYVLIGGYLTLAQIDLFQGCFLLLVLLFVPLYVGGGIGWSEVASSISANGRSVSLMSGSVWNGILLAFGWGMGYFGQPHILTKFMGIRKVEEIRSAKVIGVSWLVLSLGAASVVGFVGVAYFAGHLDNPETVFIDMVRGVFPPFVAGIFLCAVIAAILNAVSSMLLVLSSTFSEDIYGRFLKKSASSSELVKVARLSSVGVALLAMAISLSSGATIDQLVFYAWSGLGASFGPLLIMSLYSKRLTERAAWSGIVAGGGTVAFWPFFGVSVPALVVAFPFALAVIWLVSRLSAEVDIEFN